MRNKDKNYKVHLPNLLPRLTSLLHSQLLPPLPVMTGKMGIVVSSSQLLLSPHNFFLLQQVPPVG